MSVKNPQANHGGFFASKSIPPSPMANLAHTQMYQAIFALKIDATY